MSTGKVADDIHGYAFGAVPRSATTLAELRELEVTVGLTDDDRRYLKLAGEVLGDQTKAVVLHWRAGIIASIPNLARHSRALDDQPLPDYLAKSNLRFEQWILDTCLRPYDQEWLDYQEEIALRHTSLKKNQTDGASSTTHVPLRDITAFIAVMNETIEPYLAKKGHSADDVRHMHRAWCKSMQLQLALWSRPYAERVPNEW